MQTDIQPFDLYRIFIGDVPLLFTLEVVFRTVVIYLYTLLLVRWLGQRAVAQLSLIEFLLVIALGSAVGDPMFYPDVSLLHAMIVISTVVLLNRGMDWLVKRNKVAEKTLEGRPMQLVENGMLCLDNIRRANVANAELYQQLRLSNVENLGAVRQGYIEQDGKFSVFCFGPGERPPGLPINPPWEIVQPPVRHADTTMEEASILACMECGNLQEAAAGERLPRCGRCHHAEWTFAT